MSKSTLSTREIFMIALLAVILIAASYYLFYFQPLQNDLIAIQDQITQADSGITTAAAKIGSMQKMQDELDAIHETYGDNATEIAPFDNAKVVMSQLNSILSASDEYTLRFTDPVESKDGTVRRTVSMDFACKNYESAKSIIEALSSSHWRCLITSISVSAGNITYVAEGSAQPAEELAEEAEAAVYDGIMTNNVNVKATIVFFESTKIAK